MEAAAPDRATLDEPRLLDRVGGDRLALRRLVRLFLVDSRELVERIRRAMAKGSAPDLRAAAHALKGSVSNFAAPAATAAAARLQQIGAGGDLAEAQAAYARLDQELARVRDRLSTIVSGELGRAPVAPLRPDLARAGGRRGPGGGPADGFVSRGT